MTTDRTRGRGGQVGTHFVYVAACADGSLYTGYTTDLARRMAVHNRNRGARYTRGRGPVRLLYHEALASRGEAQRREAAIKRLPRADKLALIGSSEEKAAAGPGTLYLCPTPIGNLEDVTLRVLRVLREADVVAAEDTRQARKLLRHYDIATPLLACHGHNERRAAAEIVERLRSGQIVALVSDAGAPTVSDPGAEAVRAARAAGLPVVALPGPSAVLTALAGSGKLADRFVFDGFLPRAGAERQRRLHAIATEPRAVVLFEAPHRVVRTLHDLSDVIGDRPVVVARELTKRFEEHREGSAAELAAHYEAVGPRGEFTLVITPVASGIEAGEPGEERANLEAALASVARRVRDGCAPAEAVKAAARERGLRRRDVYQAWTAARGENATQE